jgi:histidinol-phosphatase (PHP family)
MLISWKIKPDMRGLVDYHTHSLLSDGSGCYEEMVLTAIEKGLDEIGFSDHVSLKPVTWAMQDIDLPVMTRQILKIRERFGHLINIRYGIEMDYFPGKEMAISRIIESLPLDYVIGSVHFIDDWNFDGDRSFYGKWSNDELYHTYFDLVQKAAKSGLFDILGHVDLIKKFAIYPETDQTSLLEETAAIIARSDVVIEVNTAGLDKPCNEFYPGQHLLEILHANEVPVTLSSDAHHPAQIARHYEQALRQLRNTGYHQIMKFNNRKKTAVKI